MKEKDEETEIVGSDLEQMVAMLEKAEIDYDKEEEEDDEITLHLGSVDISFNEDGELLSISQN